MAYTLPETHFLGTIVVEPLEKVGLRGVDTLHIADGQQRLTTLQSVLAADRVSPARYIVVQTGDVMCV